MSNQLTPGVWYSFPCEEGTIEIQIMDIKTFLALSEWITQRNVDNRLKKKGVLDHLSKLFPTHYIVAVGELTENDVWEDGTKYSKGQLFRIDANSRAKMWTLKKSDAVPENVLAIKFSAKTLIELRNIYWAYDNPTAAEQTAEICQGIFKSVNYEPATKKFKDGAIVTALSYACMFHAKETFGADGLWTNPEDDTITLTEFRRTRMLLAVLKYLDTVKAVDQLLAETGYNKQFDATFMTSLFLYHIKKGVFSDNVKYLLKLIAENVLDEDGDPVGIAIVKKGKVAASTWIARENGRNHEIIIPDRGKRDGFYQGVPFFCYWMDVVDTNGNEHKQNQGPRGGYHAWFETFMARTPIADLEKAYTAS